MFENFRLTSLKTRALILLARSPGRSYYLREIARELESSPGGIHPVLNELSSDNLIKSKTKGRNKYFSINSDNPAVKHFKIFYTVQEIMELIEKVMSRSQRIILYGSCATGNDTQDSDIDLFIVSQAASEVNRKLTGKNINGREVKAVVKKPHEFIKLKEKDRGFYRELEEGMVLWRSKNE